MCLAPTVQKYLGHLAPPLALHKAVWWSSGKQPHHFFWSPLMLMMRSLSPRRVPFIRNPDASIWKLSRWRHPHRPPVQLLLREPGIEEKHGTWHAKKKMLTQWVVDAYVLPAQLTDALYPSFGNSIPVLNCLYCNSEYVVNIRVPFLPSLFKIIWLHFQIDQCWLMSCSPSNPVWTFWQSMPGKARLISNLQLWMQQLQQAFLTEKMRQ